MKNKISLLILFSIITQIISFIAFANTDSINFSDYKVKLYECNQKPLEERSLCMGLLIVEVLEKMGPTSENIACFNKEQAKYECKIVPKDAYKLWAVYLKSSSTWLDSIEVDEFRFSSTCYMPPGNSGSCYQTCLKRIADLSKTACNF